MSAPALQSFVSQLWTSQALVAERSDWAKHRLWGLRWCDSVLLLYSLEAMAKCEFLKYCLWLAVQFSCSFVLRNTFATHFLPQPYFVPGSIAFWHQVHRELLPWNSLWPRHWALVLMHRATWYRLQLGTIRPAVGHRIRLKGRSGPTKVVW